MEQQILKAINHIKYISKKDWPYPVYINSRKKKPITTFDGNSLSQIKCEMQ